MPAAIMLGEDSPAEALRARATGARQSRRLLWMAEIRKGMETNKCRRIEQEFRARASEAKVKRNDKEFNP